MSWKNFVWDSDTGWVLINVKDNSANFIKNGWINAKKTWLIIVLNQGRLW